MQIELPADISIGLNRVWGERGLLAIVTGQTTRLAPRRVTDMQGNAVVCPNRVTSARFTVDLIPREEGKPALTPGEITRQHR